MRNFILVTGATGFIGRFLCVRLLSVGHAVRGAMRSSGISLSLAEGMEPVAVEPLGPDTPWEHALDGIDTVIHLAARSHIMIDATADPMSEFRYVNVAGSERLACEAAKAGVKRLVFISSIKVNGEETLEPFTSDSPPNPSDPYGISKWEAEQVLRRIEAETGLEVVVIRPTMVYGPGVKANFLKLLEMVDRGVPLPLESIHNQRSFINLENLVDAIATCILHPKAAGQTYLVSDGEDVSIPELIQRLAALLGKPARMFPFPPGLLMLAGRLLGKSAAVERLVGTLQVDCSKIRREMGWTPPFKMEQGLKETVEWYKKTVLDSGL
jgi:nucleoside-diphosphate-sugar epimerase